MEALSGIRTVLGVGRTLVVGAMLSFALKGDNVAPTRPPIENLQGMLFYVDTDLEKVAVGTYFLLDNEADHNPKVCTIEHVANTANGGLEAYYDVILSDIDTVKELKIDTFDGPGWVFNEGKNREIGRIAGKENGFREVKVEGDSKREKLMCADVPALSTDLDTETIPELTNEPLAAGQVLEARVNGQQGFFTVLECGVYNRILIDKKEFGCTIEPGPEFGGKDVLGGGNSGLPFYSPRNGALIAMYKGVICLLPPSNVCSDLITPLTPISDN